MNRREFAGSAVSALAALAAKSKRVSAKSREWCPGESIKPAGKGRIFHSLADARAAILRPGDAVLIRDMGQIGPRNAASSDGTGKWTLRNYRLSNGHFGRLLLANDRIPPEAMATLNDEFEIRLDLPGCYALWIGVPMLNLAPTIASYFGGVDVALDTDPAFVLVGPERGTRHGKVMGPMNVEVMCYWKCAQLDGRSLRVRLPFGTFVSLPWGMARGSVSSLQLLRLSHEQVEAYEYDTSNPETKRVIVVNDGFSPYWNEGQPGKGVDVRFPQQYRASDVKMYFLQTPSTGVASWPSKVTGLLGEGVTSQQWKRLRLGDRRAYEYIQWAVKHHQEGFRVGSGLCRKVGLQFHASLRMNLFFKNGPTAGEEAEEYFNGCFWWKHPEFRKPGSVQLDYARPEVREFILAILMELAASYDVDGLNLDFTRWPPIVDPARDNFGLLTGFIAEVRRRLDCVGSEKSRKLALSAMVVDGYQARHDGHLMSLEDQKIDLRAWLAGGALDFICVEAWDHRKHLSLAKRFHTPYYAIQDQESIKYPGGSRDDPDWRTGGHVAHDPRLGEETETQPPIQPTLDPTEYYQAFLPRYRMGVDGACIVNGGGNFLRRLGHVRDMEEQLKAGTVWGQQTGSRISLR